jgi:PTH1 family peptidyl-tRNA hydrolase
MDSLIIPQLIIGLGNPEPKYDKTRHNIGFEAVDALAKQWGVSWQENKRFKGMVSTGTKLHLLKPLTYMNLSGQSVRAMMDWYKLTPASILVIYDDMDLPLGKIRLRLSGSAGGHNGMKSIISHLSSEKFARLRLGIGKSGLEKETISHVLGKFAPSEVPITEQVLKLVLETVDSGLKQGLEKTMSLYNNAEVKLS